jgi:hypothetical protein
MSNFTDELLKKLTYHKSMTSTEIAFENLKKMHPSLSESNPFAIAYMACNPALPEEERENLKKCFKLAMEIEQKKLEETISRFNMEREVNDYIHRYENSDVNESKCDN